MKRAILTLVAGAFVLSLALSGSAAEKDSKTEAKIKKQTICPVMGGKINKKLYVDVKGKRIYVCCGGCIAAIKKSPEKYLKKAEADGVTLDKATASKHKGKHDADKGHKLH